MEAGSSNFAAHRSSPKIGCELGFVISPGARQILTELPETVLIGVDELVKFLPLKNALATLANLLEIYWSGLSRPLPFFPLSALEFAKAKLFHPKTQEFHH